MEYLKRQISELKESEKKTDKSQFTFKQQLKDLEAKTKPITDYEHNFLKELSAVKWDALMNRVNKINDEVFEQVMEAEMALAGLETEDIDKIYIPEHMKKKNSKTLLKRMSTLKLNILAKKSGGKVAGQEFP